MKKTTMVLGIAAALGIGALVNAGVSAHGNGFGAGYGYADDDSGCGHRISHMMRRHGDRHAGHFDDQAEHAMPMGHARGPGALSRLGLSDEQRAQVQVIQRELRQRQAETGTKLRAASERLRALNGAETRDRGAIDQAYDEIFNLRRELVRAREDARAATDKVLTDQQRETAAEWGRGEYGPCLASTHRQDDD